MLRDAAYGLWRDRTASELAKHTWKYSERRYDAIICDCARVSLPLKKLIRIILKREPRNMTWLKSWRRKRMNQ
jgi:hypothetical protein